ncbi:MAG TPA: hypothetical protein VGL71_07175 [Urbifossiella sp.]|jgi:hypothetical protein
MSEYLVQYGRLAFVGRFSPARSVGEGAFIRGDRVVIRGLRGLELGTVLGAAIDRFHHSQGDGELLRPASIADFAAAERGEALGQEILAAAERAGLPIGFIDIEMSLDAATAVLHGLPWSECDASPLFADLSDRFGVAVRLLDLSRTPTIKDVPEPAGCGKPGCGSEAGGGCSSCGTGGGCSSGSCSSGKVKSAGELTAYFADLREKMEADGMSRRPLV